MTCECGNELIANGYCCERCLELDGDVGDVGDVVKKKRGRELLLDVMEHPMTLNQLAGEVGMSVRHTLRLVRGLLVDGAIARREGESDHGHMEYVYRRVR